MTKFRQMMPNKWFWRAMLLTTLTGAVVKTASGQADTFLGILWWLNTALTLINVIGDALLSEGGIQIETVDNPNNR